MHGHRDHAAGPATRGVTIPWAHSYDRVAALLKLARLDAGTAAFKSEPVDVRRLIERALEPLQIPLEIKKQRLEVHGEEDASFTGDLNWNAEALTNVVKNCVEHSPEGGKIEIAYAANALYAEITVSDNGEGIASQDLPNIFNRFYRGENGGENSVGIGLALAKAIFTAQGGDITVHSQRGMGTSFAMLVMRSGQASMWAKAPRTTSIMLKSGWNLKLKWRDRDEP